MADVKIARIFLRRGDDASRLPTILCEGELGYSTDGERVFVGNDSTEGGISVGSKMFFLSPTSGANPDVAVSTLTAVSADGRAEIGDFAFVPASSYYLSSFNPDYSNNDLITPEYTVGTIYTLSARDGGTGDLTWMYVNSGIPIKNIIIPDNSINGNKIHGGNISGDVTFSGTVTAASLSTNDILVKDLEGTGNRVVFATSAGILSTNPSDNIITSTLYFNKQNLTTNLTYKDNTAAGTVTPLAGDGNWTSLDVSTALTNAGVTLPVTYPKAAIISVYHSQLAPSADRSRYALFSSSAASSYNNQYYVLGRWTVGEDATGGSDTFGWGSVIVVPMNGSNNNIVLQHTLINTNYGGDFTQLAVDLIGIQY